jgi:WD40 repeat protein
VFRRDPVRVLHAVNPTPTDRSKPRVEEWDLLSGRLVRVLESGAQQYVRLVGSVDGRRLVGWTREGDKVGLEVWDLDTGKSLSRMVAGTYRATVPPCFHPNGRWLVVNDLERVLLLDGDTGETKQTLVVGKPYSHVAFHPKEPRAAIFTEEGVCKIWDVSSGRELLGLGGLPATLGTLAFSADGHTLVAIAGRGVGAVQIWDGRPWREPGPPDR